MKRREFTPLTELPPHQQSIVGCMPEGVPVERIGLAQEHLGRIASWGGFYPDVAIEGFRGPTTDYAPAINGMTLGGALAGMRSVKRVPMITAQIGEVPHFISDLQLGRSRSRLDLQVNVAEWEDRVRKQSDGVIRHPDPWTQVLNDELKLAMRGAAWHHLTGRPLPVAEVFSVFAAAAGGYWAGVIQLPADENIAHLLTTTGMFALAGPQCIKLIGSRLSKYASRTRTTYINSVVPVFHADRAVGVSGLSRFGRLAKALP